MSNERTEIISVQEFRTKTMKKQLRPAAWNWEEIYPELMESLESSEDGRGAVSLVHKDTGDQAGVSPSLNVIVQIFKPGVRDHAHRHSNVALFFVYEGEGYSVVDGERIDWKEGDLVLAPAWSAHEHCNTSETENAILITFQDVPQVSNLRTWFFEEPVGTEPKHVVGEEKDEFTT
jgi:gentisate 1,2-dioxygenase